MTFLAIAGSAKYPSAEISIDFANGPLDAATSWTDVTTYVRQWGFKRGVDHELGRASPGELSVVLSNRDGRFDPEYTSGAYYPNVKAMRRVRVRLQWNAVTYDQFLGVIQGWPIAFPASGFDSTVTVTALDISSILAQWPLSGARATLSTSFGNNADLTFTSKGAGAGGNAIAIQYILPGSHHYHTSVNVGGSTAGSGQLSPFLVTVTLARPGVDIVSTASDIRDAVNAHVKASTFVSAELKTGSDGSGIPPGMQPTYLTGGDFAAAVSDARITEVLDEVGVPAGFRSLETGKVSVIDGSWGDEDGVRALQHMHDVAEAEDGRVYCDVSGKVTFENRTHRVLDLTSTLTLGDQTGEVPYRGLVVTNDISEVWNQVRITPADNDQAQEALGTASIAAYGQRPYDRSLLFEGDEEALDRATYYLQRYAEPDRRTPTLEVLGAQGTTAQLLVNWPLILARDISDRVTRIRRARWGATMSDEQHIEGIQMNCDNHGLRIVWQLSPADPYAYWQLGDATYGKLGQTARLAWA